MPCNPRRWSAAQETPQCGPSLSSVHEDLRLLMYDAIYNGELIHLAVRYKAWLWVSKPLVALMSCVCVVS